MGLEFVGWEGSTVNGLEMSIREGDHCCCCYLYLLGHCGLGELDGLELGLVNPWRSVVTTHYGI